MPKKSMDYSNVYFYKIVCKDLSITECYVGQTTNFNKRKSYHKSSCINNSDKKHHLLVYDFIREHGSWDNWSMILIETRSFDNVLEANKRERELIEELSATLNKVVPCRTVEEYKIDKKDEIKERWGKYYDEHKEEIALKRATKITCDCGSIYTKREKHRHCKTKKHQQYLQRQQEGQQ